ncbi:MAG: hypothetical protein GY948_16180 [Alphaproteobacteria bacterium]|nr:hypothetical protein [Alphaproteobacteria bacterium]
MSKTAEMKRFKDVLLAYGANPENWPADDHETLRKIASSGGTEVQACLREAREMDAVLNHLPEARVPDGAIDRALAKVMVPPSAPVVDLQAVRAQRSRFRDAIDMRQAIPVGIAMAASLMLGVLAGFSDLTSTYIPDTGTITLASIDEDSAAESLISFEAFTFAEGDVQ